MCLCETMRKNVIVINLIEGGLILLSGMWKSEIKFNY